MEHPRRSLIDPCPEYLRIRLCIPECVVMEFGKAAVERGRSHSGRSKRPRVGRHEVESFLDPRLAEAARADLAACGVDVTGSRRRRR